MLTSKQRAYLRGLANDLDPTFHVGKGGVTEAVVEQINLDLNARELIKIKVLENAPVFAKEAAHELAKLANADVVQVIGTKAVLFKQRDEDSQFEI